MLVPIQLRRDIRSIWSAQNPILLDGEIGLETDSEPLRAKCGDGVSRWNQLGYFVPGNDWSSGPVRSALIEITDSAQIQLFSFPASIYRSAEFTLQITDPTRCQTGKIRIQHQNAQIRFLEYGCVFDPERILDFVAVFDGPSLCLRGIPLRFPLEVRVQCVLFFS